MFELTYNKITKIVQSFGYMSITLESEELEKVVMSEMPLVMVTKDQGKQFKFNTETNAVEIEE